MGNSNIAKAMIELLNAFRQGAQAFKDGLKISNNPYGFLSDLKTAYQWDRGFRMCRKKMRFAATIAARKECK